MIITLDGPAGSGKSTISRRIARKLGINFLDTGATYRCVTLEILRQGLLLSEIEHIRALVGGIDIRFEGEKVFINGQDCSADIRGPEIDHHVSSVSELSVVRQGMTALQKKIASTGDYIAEGRDMGTAVFPEAQYKFYLDADVAVRARRRYLQNREQGRDELPLAEIEAEIRRRDEIDSGRAVAPLRPAEDALIIDTGNMSIDEVTQYILKHIQSQD